MNSAEVQFERRDGKSGQWKATTEAEVRVELSVLFPDTDPAVVCMVEGGDIIPTPAAYFRARPAA